VSAPDVVFVVRPGDANHALRYALRSLQHVPHGRVWIAGYKPSWVKGVRYVPVPQRGTKYENSTANLRAACSHPDLSEEFLFWQDDVFLMRPVGSIGMYHRGPVAGVERYYASRAHGMYLRGLRETRALLKRLGYPDPLSYELHVPMPMRKTEVLKALDIGRNIRALHKRTLYGNLFGVGGTRMRDPKVVRLNEPVNTAALFLSTMPQTFEHGKVGQYIRRSFPDASPYEGRR